MTYFSLPSPATSSSKLSQATSPSLTFRLRSLPHRQVSLRAHKPSHSCLMYSSQVFSSYFHSTVLLFLLAVSMYLHYLHQLLYFPLEIYPRFLIPPPPPISHSSSLSFSVSSFHAFLLLVIPPACPFHSLTYDVNQEFPAGLTKKRVESFFYFPPQEAARHE